MRIASESVADNELCPFNALASALTAGRQMTSHVDMLRRSDAPSHVGRQDVSHWALHAIGPHCLVMRWRVVLGEAVSTVVFSGRPTKVELRVGNAIF